MGNICLRRHGTHGCKVSQKNLLSKSQKLFATSLFVVRNDPVVTDITTFKSPQITSLAQLMTHILDLVYLFGLTNMADVIQQTLQTNINTISLSPHLMRTMDYI